MKLPIWSLAPFACVLLTIAALPTLAPGIWKRFGFMILTVFSLPILCMSAIYNPHWVLDGFVQYMSFICLLAALYAIGGGLFVNGAPKANPFINLGYMAIGSILANLIGSLGASMLLIRPLLRSNRGRKHQKHVVIFFIFIVSNVAGLLTPIGDPPVLMGYLSGVPFWWPMKLFAIWFFVLTALFAVFTALDAYFYIQDPDFRGPLRTETKIPFHIVGRWNLSLAILVAVGLLAPQYIPAEFSLWRDALRVGILISVIYLSNRLTPKQISALNGFSWEPFREIALIFAAIFATMIPAIRFLEIEGHRFVSDPSAWNLFWASGSLSAFLDNAPTYASFFAFASGLGTDFATVNLGDSRSISEPLLMAITCGSVFFGAMSYIGNGPNLLVKAVAEGEKIPMPSFFGYMLWSLVFLLPILFFTSIIFFY